MLKYVVYMMCSMWLCCLGGCPDFLSWEETTNDCDLDPTGCSENESAFPPEPVCEKTAPLQVELGTGDTAFRPLDSTREMNVIYGPQGGFHGFFAVRVDGVDLEKSPLLRVHITQGQGHDRTLILGSSRALSADDSGRIEAAGILFYSPSLQEARLTVEDMCGNIGMDSVAGESVYEEYYEGDTLIEFFIKHKKRAKF